MEISNLKRTTIICLSAGLILISIVYFGIVMGFKKASPRDYITQRPVGNNVYNYDNAGILGDIKESTERYLEIFKKDYAIETVIVTLPALPQTHTIESLAVDSFMSPRIPALS